jgi:hypothetical protein
MLATAATKFISKTNKLRKTDYKKKATENPLISV